MELVVSNAGFQSVNGNYHQIRHEVIPTGFAKVCNEQGWNSSKMWSKLNGLNYGAIKRAIDWMFGISTKKTIHTSTLISLIKIGG